MVFGHFSLKVPNNFKIKAISAFSHLPEQTLKKEKYTNIWNHSEKNY